MDPKTGCPEDYTELFREYFGMMTWEVSRSGIAYEDVQDVTMDILARFIEKDGISYYDPEHLHDVGESPDLPGARYRKAKFKGMLRGFTRTYVMAYRDKQMTRHRREPWRCDTPIWHHGAKEPVSWLEATFGDDPEADDALIDSEVSMAIVQALREVRSRLDHKSTLTRDYTAFIDACVRSGYLDGKLDRQKIMDELGISKGILNVMLREFRQTLRPILADAGLMTEVA